MRTNVYFSPEAASCGEDGRRLEDGRGYGLSPSTYARMAWAALQVSEANAAEPTKVEGLAVLARTKWIVLLSWNAAVFACQQFEEKKEVDELNERLA